MMKKIFSAAMLSIAMLSQAQTIESARKELDNENFYKAKTMLLGMVNNGSFDQVQVYYYLGNAYLNTDNADSAKFWYGKIGSATKTAYGYLGNGRLALLNNNIPAAKELFEKAAIITKNKNSEVLYQIGNAWYKPTIVNLREAIYNFEDAWKIDPKNSTNTLALGDAYLDNNEGGKAMSKYESAAEVNPKLTMAYIKIGRLNVRGRIYDDAVSAYKKALALEPENALAHKELGEAYYLTKKYDLAKVELQKYAELTPEDVDAKARIISFLFQLKEYEQAATASQDLLQTDPSNLLALRGLMYSDMELKRYQDGNAVAQQFWAIADKDKSKVKPMDFVYAARLAAQVGDTARAFAYFAPALTADSTNADLYSEYAKILYTGKRYQDAANQYAAKNAKFGNLTSLDLYYWGRANYAAANYASADSAFAQFADKNPTSPDGWLWLAKSSYKIDSEMKDSTASNYYKKYIEIAQADPAKNKANLGEAYRYLGIYNYYQKDNAAAKSYFDKALELDPNDTDAKNLKEQMKL